MSPVHDSCCEGAAEAYKAAVGRFPKGVLPDADDFPALAAELAVDSVVTGPVVLALFVPELLVGFRSSVAVGAAVPETAVDKDRDLLLGKGEVRLSGQRKMPSPAGEVIPLQQDEQGQLSLDIAPPSNQGHDFRALLFCTDVRHTQPCSTARFLVRCMLEEREEDAASYAKSSDPRLFIYFGRKGSQS